MARPRSQVGAVCQNPQCRFYLKEEDKNIIKSGKYATGHQRYYCHHCDTYFMETKGTPLYRKHLSEEQIINICKHLVEKNGVRSIGRLTGHHRDTIGIQLEDTPEHAEKMDNYFIKNLNHSQYKCEEFLTFDKKNR